MTARTEVVLEDSPTPRDGVTLSSIAVTERVFERMDERGWTPEQVAAASGIGCIRLSGRLNLQAPWSLAEIEAISDAFGIAVPFWLGAEGG